MSAPSLPLCDGDYNINMNSSTARTKFIGLTVLVFDVSICELTVGGALDAEAAQAGYVGCCGHATHNRSEDSGRQCQ